MVCNIEPAYISRSLLHALLKMIYTVRTNILFSEIIKGKIGCVASKDADFRRIPLKLFGPVK